jgi:hypothetical protein
MDSEAAGAFESQRAHLLDGHQRQWAQLQADLRASAATQLRERLVSQPTGGGGASHQSSVCLTRSHTHEPTLHEERPPAPSAGPSSRAVSIAP